MVESDVVERGITAADAWVIGEHRNPPTAVRATIAEARDMRNCRRIKYFTVPSVLAHQASVRWRVHLGG